MGLFRARRRAASGPSALARLLPLLGLLAASSASLLDVLPAYAPDFGLFERSILGRAPPGVTSLANNVPEQLNVDPGTTQVFVFEKAAIFSDGDSAAHVELRRGEADEGDAPPRLARRAAVRTVYFSANTCIQPQWVNASAASSSSGSSNSTSTSSLSAGPPQLTLYVSTTASNIAPGPGGDASKQTKHVFTEGAIMVAINATDDVYIGISAPNITTAGRSSSSAASSASSASSSSSSSAAATTSAALTGTYNFQVAASVDGWYHSYDNETAANLVWVDSDASAALLITRNLTDSTDAATDAALMATPPYVMFAQNAAYAATSIAGVRFSYCGLQTYAQIAATNEGKFTSMVTTGMTRTGLGNLPKQQFYFSGLNASSEYVGILAALPQNGTAAVGSAGVVGGGGRVARATNFTTKAAGANCEVVFNLTFCNETAYAVPSNPRRFTSATDLARVYDDYAAGMFDTFRRVLDQVPCEAPATQRYSLARDCDDCAAAYKRWLCSVAIPRCADFSDSSPWLQPRAISQPFADGSRLDPAVAAQFPNSSAYNASRNPFIDETIAPGPYKEVLPCDDLCYNLVQSCPASIGFACPQPGYQGFNTSYGLRTAADQDGYVTCNYPGSAHYFSAAPARPRRPWRPAVLAAAAGSLVVAVL